VTNSLSMLTAIPEVDLGMEWVIKIFIIVARHWHLIPS
jgi:hypothetical protein